MSKESQVDRLSSLDSSKDSPGEKKAGVETTTGAVEVENGVIIENGLRRGLLGRHVTLISLASVIGAGCFYGFGYALYLSGPLGALIGFSIIGKFSASNLFIPEEDAEV